MKISILLILSLLILHIMYCQEDNGDELIYLYNVSKCYGQVEIKVRADNLSKEDFVLVECNIKDNDITRWICPCKDNTKTSIILDSNTDKHLIFDFVLEYKLDLENEDITEAQANKRTTSINNVEINKQQFKSKKKGLPSIEGSKKIIVIGIIVLVIMIFIIILIFKKISSSKDNLLQYDEKEIGLKDNVDKFLDN